jgi:hypothetical protein
MTAHDEVELGEEFFCSVLPVVTDRRLHKLRRKINRLFEKAARTGHSYSIHLLIFMP